VVLGAVEAARSRAPYCGQYRIEDKNYREAYHRKMPPSEQRKPIGTAIRIEASGVVSRSKCSPGCNIPCSTCRTLELTYSGHHSPVSVLGVWVCKKSCQARIRSFNRREYVPIAFSGNHGVEIEFEC
jgi:hypothetical protein